MIVRTVLGVVAIVLGGAFVGALNPGSEAIVTEGDEDKEKLIMMAVLRIIESRHFSPAEIDDAFSRKVFDTYMKRLDGGKRFLMMGEYDLMEEYDDKIDDAIQNTDLEFFEISYDIINRAVDRIKLIYPVILDRPFDFTIEEHIELDGDKLEYAKDEAQLENRWRQYLKHETMTRLAEKVEEQETADDPEGGKKNVAELETEAREEVRKMMEDWFQRLEEVRRQDRFETYLNSIANSFDPHSDYFNPKAKEDFNISMSRRLEGIGARLQRAGSYTKIASIVPGGPAWKQGDLSVDDVIHAVTQDKGEPVDIYGMHIDEVVSMIRGDKGTGVTLTVKKVEGEIMDIRILREEVKLDEGLAQSAIIEFPGKVDKVGYIKLPKFYADFENPDGRSCAEDVATELEKLKDRNVEGIILDLRNNSGGSLTDVVEMTGLFIKEGPIVQVKSREDDPYVFRDKDPSVQYVGPLIVMVNSYSASASEILAAALQDYGRAIIVGSKSTFGKGTVQRFYDLDRVVRANEDLKPLGELKLTMQKFYRIDGGSTQLDGVVPDILLPDRFSQIDVGEKQLDNPMPWTKIQPVDYSQDVSDLSSLREIESKSANRIENNEVFSKIEADAYRVKKLRERSEIPLQLEQYQSEEKALDEEAKQYRNLFQEIDGLYVYNLTEDMEHIQLDSSRISRNDAWLAGLRKDVYLDETVSIMHDMIMAGVAIADEKKP